MRTDVPLVIEWQCTDCGDEGVIRGWEGSPFDLRRRRPELVSTSTVEVVIPDDVAATLRGLLLVDTAGERVVFRARATDGGVALAAGRDGLDELLGHVAAEANHETDVRRQRRLDRAFEALRDAVERER